MFIVRCILDVHSPCDVLPLPPQRRQCAAESGAELRAAVAGAAHSFDELIRAAKERRPPSSAMTASAPVDAADAIVATADSGGARAGEPVHSGRADTEPAGGCSDEQQADARPNSRQRSPLSHGTSAAMPNGGPHSDRQRTEGAEEDEEQGDPWQAQSPMLRDDDWRQQGLAGSDPADAGLAQRAPDGPMTSQARDITGLQLVLEPT